MHTQYNYGIEPVRVEKFDLNEDHSSEEETCHDIV